MAATQQQPTLMVPDALSGACSPSWIGLSNSPKKYLTVGGESPRKSPPVSRDITPNRFSLRKNEESYDASLLVDGISVEACKDAASISSPTPCTLCSTDMQLELRAQQGAQTLYKGEAAKVKAISHGAEAFQDTGAQPPSDAESWCVMTTGSETIFIRGIQHTGAQIAAAVQGVSAQHAAGVLTKRAKAKLSQAQLGKTPQLLHVKQVGFPQTFFNPPSDENASIEYEVSFDIEAQGKGNGEEGEGETMRTVSLPAFVDDVSQISKAVAKFLEGNSLYVSDVKRLGVRLQEFAEVAPLGTSGNFLPNILSGLFARAAGGGMADVSMKELEQARSELDDFAKVLSRMPTVQGEEGGGGSDDDRAIEGTAMAIRCLLRTLEDSARIGDGPGEPVKEAPKAETEDDRQQTVEEEETFLEAAGLGDFMCKNKNGRDCTSACVLQ
uniref:Uncharacterized protein n=1 Tax=Chromera velia CCMP2878 TaxID=1169474 RepID=A0A0G4FA36_9ALVE|eukprot:Cvel_15843.t1-p1 / transcript=Cvel_15843.t1 / gene=Cvel_15843 / organism=Chromera_velia_CCMP2878 / gene_product=hypothetical protein / transcript_product=hypothetical protein / location=Cvel_scaffold1192:34834-36653(+) / protein_length=439 / sequence_SO=supercontig / SO=protein_coding / is_pseudo=false